VVSWGVWVGEGEDLQYVQIPITHEHVVTQATFTVVVTQQGDVGVDLAIRIRGKHGCVLL
jgi:hypothetical protein